MCAIDAPLFYQRDGNEKEAPAYKCLTCNAFSFQHRSAVVSYRFT